LPARAILFTKIIEFSITFALYSKFARFKIMMKKIIKNLLKMYLPRNDHEAQKDYWDSQSSEWRYIAEPFRPSNRELKYYENFLDTVNDKKRILLLGSTPELRDLFARYYNASKIYLCDFSWKMLEETTKELRSADPEKEIWIKADWMDTSFPQSFFDIIIGDLVFMQFPPDQTGSFLKKISGLLSEGGIFIIRSRCRKESTKSAKGLIQDAINEYKDGDLNKAATSLLWELYDVCTKNNDTIIDKKRAAEEINEYTKEFGSEHPLLSLTLKKNQRTTKKDTFRWHWVFPFENDLSNLFSESFLIKNEKTIVSNHTSCYPIFFLEKRSGSQFL